MTRPNESAFPRPASEDTTDGTQADGNRTIAAQSGLTKREYFAAMAMQGMIAHGPVLGEIDPSIEGKVKHCVRLADALLAELSKESENG